MSYDEFINQIVESEPNEWLYDDEFNRYVFKNNISISIISDNSEDQKEFYEEWVEEISDKVAYKSIFLLCFNGAIVETFYTVAVDGYRCLIPYVDTTSMSITHKKYEIGKILNKQYQDLDEYLEQAEIKVIG